MKIAKRARLSCLFLALAAAHLGGPARASADPAAYEAGFDPAVAVHLISYGNFGSSGQAIWQDAVQDVYDHGIRAISVDPLRFVDLSSGAIRLSDGSNSGPDNDHIAAALARAAALGMSVILDPFVEPDGFSIWRGQMNFSGAAKTKIWSDYQAYLVEMAALAEANGVSRMLVGTELRDITRDPSHNADWASLISAVDATFSENLGYAANWDNYRDANLTATIWEHPAIDFLGIDAYLPLASSAEAAGLASPDVALLVARWNDIFDDAASGFAHGILSFSAARKGGAGMPCVLTEHGAIPYDKTTTAPYSEGPAGGAADPWEQRNDYDALMRAADGRRAAAPAIGRLEEIAIWTWGMPGVDGTLWYLDAEGDDVLEGAKAAQFLTGFVTGSVPDPGRPQSKEQQRCIDALNKNLARVAKAQSRSHRLCIKDYARGSLPGGITAESCLAADRSGKVGRASARTGQDEAKHCAAAAPDFAATNAATVNQESLGAATALLHDVFATPLDAALVTAQADQDMARCQQAVAQAAGACLDTRLGEFRKCKRSALKRGADSADALAAVCLGSDPKGRIAKRCDAPPPARPDRIRKSIERSCGARQVDLLAAFPACAAADAAALHACVSAAARQRSCGAIDQADALGQSCN